MIVKGIGDANDSFKGGEIGDCLQELRQVEADCETLRQQIIDRRTEIEATRIAR